MLAKGRLDHVLVARGFFPTRSRARDAISRRTVWVDHVLVAKAGQNVAYDAVISVADPAQNYVSRAALKLLAALEAFPVNVVGRCALDIGASTGGFTQVLLEYGAKRVLALDVGHGQLSPLLRQNPAICLLEGVNARNLTVAHLEGWPVELIVSDVSFISLTKALPPALALAQMGAQAILLVKPQFEVGRAGLGKGGLLKDPTEGVRVARRMFAWLNAEPHWRAKGLLPSPILGGDGNKEYLLFGEKYLD
ncbi:TlyA family RNA methyltransferase [Bartonella sp. DGB2]|uniref:TlyA family RNA methyltransferase n=1 Tax=Bartonella sp. DGB2 TaxID=3388426 RepID=UPI0039900CC1